MPTRLILSLTLLVLLSLSLVPLPRSVQACCMVEEDYAGRIGQAEQKALLIHRDGVEDLILGITYEITPGADGKLPKKMTWLIALPNEPMEDGGYGLAEPYLFDRLQTLAYRKLIRRLPMPKDDLAEGVAEEAAEAADEADANGVEFGRAVKVGPYDIQPVRGVGQNALDGLNKYLDSRGFKTEDDDHMAWFVEHGFTFLCIEVTPDENSASIPTSKALPPLRVRFKTEYPYYPLRYSSQQGDFRLALYTLTDKPIDLVRSMYVLEALGWENTPGSYAYPYARWKMPQTMKTSDLMKGRNKLEPLPEESKAMLGQAKSWSFGLFQGRPNPKNRPIKLWTGDCYFTLKGQDFAPLATRAVKVKPDEKTAMK